VEYVACSDGIYIKGLTLEKLIRRTFSTSSTKTKQQLPLHKKKLISSSLKNQV